MEKRKGCAISCLGVIAALSIIYVSYSVLSKRAEEANRNLKQTALSIRPLALKYRFTRAQVREYFESQNLIVDEGSARHSFAVTTKEEFFGVSPNVIRVALDEENRVSDITVAMMGSYL